MFEITVSYKNKQGNSKQKVTIGGFKTKESAHNWWDKNKNRFQNHSGYTVEKIN